MCMMAYEIVKILKCIEVVHLWRERGVVQYSGQECKLVGPNKYWSNNYINRWVYVTKYSECKVKQDENNIF